MSAPDKILADEELRQIWYELKAALGAGRVQGLLNMLVDSHRQLAKNVENDHRCDDCKRRNLGRAEAISQPDAAGMHVRTVPTGVLSCPHPTNATCLANAKALAYRLDEVRVGVQSRLDNRDERNTLDGATVALQFVLEPEEAKRRAMLEEWRQPRWMPGTQPHPAAYRDRSVANKLEAYVLAAKEAEWGDEVLTYSEETKLITVNIALSGRSVADVVAYVTGGKPDGNGSAERFTRAVRSYFGVVER